MERTAPMFRNTAFHGKKVLTSEPADAGGVPGQKKKKAKKTQ